MKETFMAFANRGEVLTKEDLATVLKVKPDYVRRNSKPPHGFIPRIPHLRQLRFDPAKMIDVFCAPATTAERPRSLTTEKRKLSENQNGGFRKCL